MEERRARFSSSGEGGREGEVVAAAFVLSLSDDEKEGRREGGQWARPAVQALMASA
jgi:hypothetical protein